MVQRRYEQSNDSYTLILMDYSMPKCDGPEAARAIISYLAPTTARPYICCVTAYENEDFQRVALESGMDQFTNKF